MLLCFPVSDNFCTGGHLVPAIQHSIPYIYMSGYLYGHKRQRAAQKIENCWSARVAEVSPRMYSILTIETKYCEKVMFIVIFPPYKFCINGFVHWSGWMLSYWGLQWTWQCVMQWKSNVFFFLIIIAIALWLLTLLALVHLKLKQ